MEGKRHCFKVSEGIYFNPGISTSVKIETLKIVFEAAGIGRKRGRVEGYGAVVATGEGLQRPLYPALP